ncbi:MAG: hypothetical protein OQJ97_14245, partial [Rhodospirillales bacterium]|nr:hypothetical protein [Rhodospirillales bacterium]
MSDQSPLSRRIKVKTLPKGKSLFEIEANAEERASLAKLYNLEKLNSLTAEVYIKPVSGVADYVVMGEFKAKITQKSVISLNSLTQTIDGELRRLYKDGDQPYEGDEILIDINEDDPPDSIDKGAID